MGSEMHVFGSCWTFQILILFTLKLEPEIDLFFKNFLKFKEIRNLWVEHNGVIPAERKSIGYENH